MACWIGLLLNPILVLYLWENVWHERIELVKTTVLTRVFRLADEIVDHKHDEIVVICALSEFEDDRTGREVVVGQGLDAIHLFYDLLKSFIDNWGVCEWVFCFHVWKNPIFNVRVHHFQVLLIEFVILINSHQILEEVLWAIYFGLFESHLIPRIAVKRWRKDISDDWGSPLFNWSLVKLSSWIWLRNIDGYFSISGFNLILLFRVNWYRLGESVRLNKSFEHGEKLLKWRSGLWLGVIIGMVNWRRLSIASDVANVKYAMLHPKIIV